MEQLDVRLMEQEQKMMVYLPQIKSHAYFRRRRHHCDQPNLTKSIDFHHSAPKYQATPHLRYHLPTYLPTYLLLNTPT